MDEDFFGKGGRGKGGIPFSSGQGDRFDEIPQPARRDNVAGSLIPLRRPFRHQLDVCGLLGVFAFGEGDDAFFPEELEGVFEGFFVDGFEVGEVALVVERLSELSCFWLAVSVGECLSLR